MWNISFIGAFKVAYRLGRRGPSQLFFIFFYGLPLLFKFIHAKQNFADYHIQRIQTSVHILHEGGIGFLHASMMSLLSTSICRLISSSLIFTSPRSWSRSALFFTSSALRLSRIWV